MTIKSQIPVYTKHITNKVNNKVSKNNDKSSLFPTVEKQNSINRDIKPVSEKKSSSYRNVATKSRTSYIKNLEYNKQTIQINAKDTKNLIDKLKQTADRIFQTLTNDNLANSYTYQQKIELRKLHSSIVEKYFSEKSTSNPQYSNLQHAEFLILRIENILSNSITNSKIIQIKEKISNISNQQYTTANKKLEFNQKIIDLNINKTKNLIDKLKQTADRILTVLENDYLANNYTDQQKTELKDIVTTIVEKYFSGEYKNNSEELNLQDVTSLINNVNNILNHSITNNKILQIKEKISNISNQQYTMKNTNERLELNKQIIQVSTENTNNLIYKLKQTADRILTVLENDYLASNYTDQQKTELKDIVTTIVEKYFSGEYKNNSKESNLQDATYLINSVNNILNNSYDINILNKQKLIIQPLETKYQSIHPMQKRESKLNNKQGYTTRKIHTVKLQNKSTRAPSIEIQTSHSDENIKDTNINKSFKLKSTRAPSIERQTSHSDENINKMINSLNLLQIRNDALTKAVINKLSELQKKEFSDKIKDFTTIKKQITVINDDSRSFYQAKYNLYINGKGRVSREDLITRLNQSEQRLNNLENLIITCLKNYRFFGTDIEKIKNKFGI